MATRHFGLGQYGLFIESVNPNTYDVRWTTHIDKAELFTYREVYFMRDWLMALGKVVGDKPIVYKF